ncbi:MAG TPA: hypothetical protein VFV68_01790, partial [Agriterribacter sp.]|nr:hypothetical protein [Agriterribacter sp.]
TPQREAQHIDPGSFARVMPGDETAGILHLFFNARLFISHYIFRNKISLRKRFRKYFHHF